MNLSIVIDLMYRFVERKKTTTYNLSHNHCKHFIFMDLKYIM